MIQEKNSKRESEDTDSPWQVRLLPFMIGLLLVLTLFFFAATCLQLYKLNAYIQAAPTLSISEIMTTGENPQLLEKQWKSLVTLEGHILQQRYHQAKALLMARIWVRYLGFVTGMILALIGAIFILGKLREPSTSISLGGNSGGDKPTRNLQMELITQSPGIFLVTMGTILMLVTIFAHHQIEIVDKPVYTSVTLTNTSEGKQKPPVQLEDQSISVPSQGGDYSELLEKARSRQPNKEEATQ